jgi:DtxR family Mn-dependent transcriptional regulator
MVPADGIMDASLSKSERETLKAAWRLTSRVGADHATRTGDLAASLGVTPGSMTTTVKRLAEAGYVAHAPYRGVQLTEAGRRTAMSVVRRHRVVERFLADMLGYTWAEADRLAPTFEHELPQEIEDRLYIALDRPTTCPHGFPIPDVESDEIPSMPPLYSLEPGDRAVVALPGSTDAAMVTFLDELGLRPGVEVEITEKHPFDGPLVLRVDGHDRTLGDKVARQILVRPIRPPATTATPDTATPDTATPDTAAPHTGRGPAPITPAGERPSGDREEQTA